MIVTFCRRFLCLSLIVTLTGCGKNFAPVSEPRWYSYSRNQKVHRVQRHETLYAIAFRYDTDYRTLARINHINPPYALRVGQVLSLRGITARSQGLHRTPGARRYYAARPVRPALITSPSNRYARSRSGWMWPVRGHVVTSFVPEQGKKGINIACNKGERVIAAADGVVAYAGSGLTGYGNLIIIKHSNEYLTAYGNNSRVLISEGQYVKAGHAIGEAGVIDRKYTGVHFEIRKSGIPVNPLNYLQKG